MDRVFIHGLKVDTIIGIHPWERRMPQPVLIDLDIGCDIKPAAISGNIEDALDYQKLSSSISGLLEQQHFTLLESAAEAVAALVLSDPRAYSVQVRIAKIAAMELVQQVGVQIERHTQADNSNDKTD